MCGRFVRKTSAHEISRIFEATNEAMELPVSYNIAPTSRVLAIVSATELRTTVDLSWGLIPQWSKDSSLAASLINARLETVSEKPSFRNLISQHRCVLPMDGYFEWKEILRVEKLKPVKQPFYFTARHDSAYSHSGMLAVAGLWTSWKDPTRLDGQVVHSAVLLTRDANEMVKQVHHRMPVLLDEQGVRSWLDHATSDPLGQLTAVAPEALAMHAVSTKVNNSRNNGRDLIAPSESASTDSEEELRLF